MKKIKVLHITNSLDPGGIETWLYNVVKKSGDADFHFDFLVYGNNSEGKYADELKKTGSKIFVCQPAVYKNPIKFYKYLKLLKKENEYTIFHAHKYVKNGYLAFLSFFIGVKFISHSHTSRVIKLSDWKNYLLKIFINLFSDYKLGCSADALTTLHNGASSKSSVLYYGIDTEKFYPSANKLIFDELPFSLDKHKVIGHVGRFVSVKNHDFLIDVAKKCIEKDETVRFVLIGDGELKETIQQKIKASGLSDKIILLPSRNDIYKYMVGCFDLLILPSKLEGLGIVLLEAQCAGVPVLLSGGVAKEAEVIPALCTRLHLNEGINKWAEIVLEKQANSFENRVKFFNEFQTTEFTIENSVAKLASIYKLVLSK